MIASGHVLPANVIALRSDRGPLFVLTINLVLHFLLFDSIPHVEPLVMGVPHVIRGHWTYHLVIADFALVTIWTLRNIWQFPYCWHKLISGYLGAIGPDLVTVAVWAGILHWQFYLDFHEFVHWWHRALTPMHGQMLGLIATVAVWIVSLKLMPKPPGILTDQLEAVA